MEARPSSLGDEKPCLGLRRAESKVPNTFIAILILKAAKLSPTTDLLQFRTFTKLHARYDGIKLIRKATCEGVLPLYDDLIYERIQSNDSDSKIVLRIDLKLQICHHILLLHHLAMNLVPNKECVDDIRVLIHCFFFKLSMILCHTYYYSCCDWKQCSFGTKGL